MASAAVVDGAVQNDARGAVFQWVDTVTGKGIALNDDGTYKGNVVADMQIMVAKAIQDGVLTNTDLLQTGVNTLAPSVVEWAEDPSLTFDPKYRCNADSMHHVSLSKARRGFVFVTESRAHNILIFLHAQTTTGRQGYYRNSSRRHGGI